MRKAPTEWLRHAADSATNLLFPPRCAWCGGESAPIPRGPWLCPACREALVDEANLPCPRCAAPLPALMSEGNHCPRCRRDKFAFSRAIALGVYAGALHDAVLQMKQPFAQPLSIALGQVLADRVARGALSFDVVAPIPMHWARRITRDANCAELLAETVARRLNLPFAPRLLAMRGWRRRQHTLLPTERRKNMRGAFRVRNTYDPRDARVLVVDDVLTTGATAHAAARALKTARAAEVTIAVVARGVGA